MQSKEMQGFGKPTDVGQYKAQLTGYSPHQDCSVQYARYWTLYLFICVYHTLYGADRPLYFRTLHTYYCRVIYTDCTYGTTLVSLRAVRSSHM